MKSAIKVVLPFLAVYWLGAYAMHRDNRRAMRKVCKQLGYDVYIEWVSPFKVRYTTVKS